MSPSPPPCRYVLLAKTPVATVRRCNHCGCISLDVGSTTLRFDDPAFLALTTALTTAATQLELGDERAFDEILRRPHGNA